MRFEHVHVQFNLINQATRRRDLNGLRLFSFFVNVVVLVVLHVWYMIMSQLYIIVYIVSHTVHIDGQ